MGGGDAQRRGIRLKHAGDLLIAHENIFSILFVYGSFSIGVYMYIYECVWIYKRTHARLYVMAFISNMHINMSVFLCKRERERARVCVCEYNSRVRRERVGMSLASVRCLTVANPRTSPWLLPVAPAALSPSKELSKG